MYWVSSSSAVDQLVTCHDEIDAGAEADPVVEVLAIFEAKSTTRNKLSLLVLLGRVVEVLVMFEAINY